MLSFLGLLDFDLSVLFNDSLQSGFLLFSSRFFFGLDGVPLELLQPLVLLFSFEAFDVLVDFDDVETQIYAYFLHLVLPNDWHVLSAVDNSLLDVVQLIICELFFFLFFFRVLVVSVIVVDFVPLFRTGMVEVVLLLVCLRGALDLNWVVVRLFMLHVCLLLFLVQLILSSIVLILFNEICANIIAFLVSLSILSLVISS